MKSASPPVDVTRFYPDTGSLGDTHLRKGRLFLGAVTVVGVGGGLWTDGVAQYSNSSCFVAPIQYTCEEPISGEGTAW